MTIDNRRGQPPGRPGNEKCMNGNLHVPIKAPPVKNEANGRGTLRSVGEILGSAMPHKLALHIKIADIKNRWADVVDSALASRSFPVMFEYESDGNDIYLLVSASSPVAAHRVKMISGRILNKLKEFWQIEITGVRVKVI